MTAVGLRVKSGYAIAVVLGGTRAAPRAIGRRVVELSDAAVPATRQPYHNAMFKTEEDPQEIARRIRIVKRCAARSVSTLIGDAGSRRAALVVGSLIDPERVTNPHIRAHASEGQLFRMVLVERLRARKIRCDVILAKELAARAADALDLLPAAIARKVAAFGKALGGPWRADEKAAATAAWLALR